MKMFLVKLGKAWSIIKSDGFFRGSKRVFIYFLRLFKKVGSGDILFISGGVGDSAMYRCYHVAEELSGHGFKCSITIQDNPYLLKYADKFKIFIMHRVLYSDKIKKFAGIVKKQDKEIIFETDDLIFDPIYLKDMEYYKNASNAEKRAYERGIGAEILNDSYIKVCTTTTPFLADKLEKYGKKVFIVPNKLSNHDLEIAEKIMRKKLGSNSSIIRIGYFSGTISHNKDFATITGALMSIMEKYPQVDLVLVGPLDVENQLVHKFKGRIIHLPFVPREKHFENISKVDINLAPLEIGNPFCEAKSELKFFEAGILGVPTVASATRTFKESIEDGVDGFVAGDANDWIEKLEKLIIDGNLRKVMGDKARRKSLERYTTKNSQNEEYYKHLREKIS